MITYLVAPTKKIQKLWREQYPMLKVYLSQKLPTHSIKPKKKSNRVGGGK